MRFSLFTLPALAVFSAAAPTASNEITERDSGSPLADMITGLTTQVKGFTAHMNSVTKALPADASDADKKAASASVIKDIEGITTAFHTTNTQLQAAQQQPALQTRQNLGNLPKDVLGSLNGQPIVFARLLNTLLQELNPALQSVLVTLSLGEVYVALQPLLRAELPGLLTNVGNLVNGLLIALAPLLAGLGGILGPLLLGLGL